MMGIVISQKPANPTHQNIFFSETGYHGLKPRQSNCQRPLFLPPPPWGLLNTTFYRKLGLRGVKQCVHVYRAGSVEGQCLPKQITDCSIPFGAWGRGSHPCPGLQPLTPVSRFGVQTFARPEGPPGRVQAPLHLCISWRKLLMVLCEEFLN